ncbi:unnamed protein product [Paramecium sonneborni]|uniref:Uncharacterized protein n=1 Tax=Paramecium sonneborni TaxID=65129 RepID=A0A8S1NG70_9CILI|nr:unnamed protein product [Paramecium sonneborni]
MECYEFRNEQGMSFNFFTCKMIFREQIQFSSYFSRSSKCLRKMIEWQEVLENDQQSYNGLQVFDQWNIVILNLKQAPIWIEKAIRKSFFWKSWSNITQYELIRLVI